MSGKLLTDHTGEWVGNKKHGQGTYTYPSKATYSGEWVGDKKHGKGTYTYSDDQKYTGDWVGDKMHGEGTYTYSDGHKYAGEWVDDKILHGKCVLEYEKEIIVGEWKGNGLNSQWRKSVFYEEEESNHNIAKSVFYEGEESNHNIAPDTHGREKIPTAQPQPRPQETTCGLIFCNDTKTVSLS